MISHVVEQIWLEMFHNANLNLLVMQIAGFPGRRHHVPYLLWHEGAKCFDDG
jgi:hypothetical protein